MDGRRTGILRPNDVDTTLSYDGAGNVQTITDNTISLAEVTTFTYDALDRLTGASGGFSAAYSYSPNGKMTGKTEGYGYTYSYDSTACPPQEGGDSLRVV